MRSSRAMLYAERLSNLTSQLVKLEDLRRLVEGAERRARGAPPSRLTRPAPSRSREPKAMSVRLRRQAPSNTNTGACSPADSNDHIDWALLEPFPDDWWASP